MLPDRSNGAGLLLPVSAEALRPLLRELVAEALAQLQAHQAALGEPQAYPEPKAAALLGLRPHQLRDERLRGRIGHSRVVGNQVRYTRQDLLDYLAARRRAPGAAEPADQ
jgi:hypothetical protein